MQQDGGKDDGGIRFRMGVQQGFRFGPFAIDQCVLFAWFACYFTAISCPKARLIDQEGHSQSARY